MPQASAKVRVMVLMGNIDAAGFGDGAIFVDALWVQSVDIAGGRLAMSNN